MVREEEISVELSMNLQHLEQLRNPIHLRQITSLIPLLLMKIRFPTTILQPLERILPDHLPNLLDRKVSSHLSHPPFLECQRH